MMRSPHIPAHRTGVLPQPHAATAPRSWVLYGNWPGTMQAGSCIQGWVQDLGVVTARSWGQGPAAMYSLHASARRTGTCHRGGFALWGPQPHCPKILGSPWHSPPVSLPNTTPCPPALGSLNELLHGGRGRSANPAFESSAKLLKWSASPKNCPPLFHTHTLCMLDATKLL